MPSQSGGLFQRNSSTEANVSLWCLFRSLLISGLGMSWCAILNSITVNKSTFRGCYTLDPCIPTLYVFLNACQWARWNRFRKVLLRHINYKAPQVLTSMPLIFSGVSFHKLVCWDSGLNRDFRGEILSSCYNIPFTPEPLEGYKLAPT